jgi:hypothetical protein
VCQGKSGYACFRHIVYRSSFPGVCGSNQRSTHPMSFWTAEEKRLLLKDAPEPRVFLSILRM